MKNKCSCYEVIRKRKYTYHPHTGERIAHDVNVAVCNGTKEQEECSCNGDRCKCDFYPEVRNKRILRGINMGFTKTFPYNIGTFVLVDLDTYDDKDPKKLINRLGTIACYQCVTEEDAFIVMVSGYKNAWCGEYLLSEIRLATEEEVNVYRNIMGIED